MTVQNPYPQAAPAKSFVVTWLLAWFLGVLGADRFYLNKYGTAVAKLITLGGLGIWALVDIILVLTGSQRDSQGRGLEGFEEHKKTAWILTVVFLVLGVGFGGGQALGN